MAQNWAKYIKDPLSISCNLKGVQSFLNMISLSLITRVLREMISWHSIRQHIRWAPYLKEENDKRGAEWAHIYGDRKMRINKISQVKISKKGRKKTHPRLVLPSHPNVHSPSLWNSPFNPWIRKPLRITNLNAKLSIEMLMNMKIKQQNPKQKKKKNDNHNNGKIATPRKLERSCRKPRSCWRHRSLSWINNLRAMVCFQYLG